MKLLFVCGASLQNGSLRCASWIKSLITYISEDFEITMLADSREGTEKTTVSFGKRDVAFIPYDFNSGTGLEDILKEISFDVCVSFGTENPFTLKTLEACRAIGALERAAVFAQGISIACADHYADGVPEKVIKRYTLRDRIRRQNIADEQKVMYTRAQSEKKAIELTRHFIGRTRLDKAVLEKYNPSAAYHKCRDVLRSGFYSGEWSYDSCEKHRMLISQYYYPLKGFHYLLDAAAKLREKYPDLKIAAAGYNPILKSIGQNELKDTSYIRYIKSLVKKYGLKDCIELLGELDEEQMKREYLRANLFVIPSTIENSPNSLAEAMMLGVPCVASDVGGIPDYTESGVDSLIFPSGDVKLLEEYIDRVFSDPEAASKMAKAGKTRAEKDYSITQNTADFEAVMRKISGAG